MIQGDDLILDWLYSSTAVVNIISFFKVQWLSNIDSRQYSLHFQA